MDHSEEINGLTLGDFVEEGRAQEAAIRMAEGVSESESKADQAAASECRELAIGIIAIAHSYIEDLLKDQSLDADLAYSVACTITFAQGAAVSGSLIARSQYMKAATTLKQDIELLVRFREIADGRAAKGKTPQLSGAPEWARRAYGELNKIAHPANLEELHSVVSAPDGRFSILPLRQHRTQQALYLVHAWNCTEMAGAVVQLLESLVNTRPPSAHAKVGLEACIETFDRLVQKVVSIPGAFT
jgi:hypothetical protein